VTDVVLSRDDIMHLGLVSVEYLQVDSALPDVGAGCDVNVGYDGRRCGRSGIVVSGHATTKAAKKDNYKNL